MRFLDTNVFIRYLTRDDAQKAAACHALFERLDRGEEVATTCEAIVVEIVYVLSARAHYGLTAEQIRERLAPTLAVPGLRLPEKRVYLRALDILVDHPALDFEDAVLAAHMERMGESELYSYDRDFHRIDGLTRLEPPLFTEG